VNPVPALAQITEPPLSVVALAAVAVLLAGVGIISAAIGWRNRAAARRLEQRAGAMLREADAIKNDFVTMISHEFRTPLASISGFAEILEAWRELPEAEVDEFLGLIELESHKLGALVEDVLVIPRLEAGRLKLDAKVFDLSAIVYEMSSLVFPTAGSTEVSVSIPSGIAAYGDERRVEQVLRNLFQNAKLYGGDQVLVEGYARPEDFVVVVSDNGPGVPDDAIDVVFHSFEQLSKGDARMAQGIGLGLPIARRLARAMGGDVWYERRFPTGSRFCFSITQSEAVAQRVLEARERMETAGRSGATG
jgi:signal transduction histidine kinase